MRGGKRAGAGRKKGQADKVSRELRERAAVIASDGITPLEMRLRLARHLWAEAIDDTGAITSTAKAKEAADVAESAMQYTSPRLAAIEVAGKDGGALEIRIIR